MRRCAWCDGTILGEAMPIPDYSASGASPPVYWHANRAECGARRRPLPAAEEAPAPQRRSS
ncbi:hypothetical protein [Streptomyces sp. NPDC008121]|uniref:hypothetical protein n=1 Tax=Streptomyces sp. NPDC008121 TaxID=3364809 RepID=UPI0036DFA9BF